MTIANTVVDVGIAAVDRIVVGIVVVTIADVVSEYAIVVLFAGSDVTVALRKASRNDAVEKFGSSTPKMKSDVALADEFRAGDLRYCWRT